MFITLTINTAKNKKNVRFATRKINPAKGWRRNLIIKKSGLIQKTLAWFKNLKKKTYRLNGHIAMY